MPNLQLKYLRGKSQVSLSTHGSHSAYCRTPAGATASIYNMYFLFNFNDQIIFYSFS